jgi:23S rRNA (guanosine2251-2'-O)-methyltransferase
VLAGAAALGYSVAMNRRSDWRNTGRKGPDRRPSGSTFRHRPPGRGDALYIYGLHPVRHALENPRRRKIALHATKNALARLEIDPSRLAGLDVRETDPKALDRLLGGEAVHQGVALECLPLAPRRLAELADAKLVVVLDQVTDPHNVGAVMRSAVAFGASALITTSRHSPVETGVLAKSASGALELIDHIEVRNLAECLEELAALDFATVGLDSEAAATLEEIAAASRIALVLGAEGKGLRQKTRQTCTHLARLDLPGAIKSLNVSNAAVLSLYIASRALADKRRQ